MAAVLVILVALAALMGIAAPSMRPRGLATTSEPPAAQASTCAFEPPYPAEKIRSRACRQRAGGELQVLVVAIEERSETLRGPYCGGDRGDVEYTGRYRLIGLVDGVVGLQIDLPGEYTFNAQRPAYGARPVATADSAPSLVALYQYAGCNNQRVELYRTDDAGAFHPVPFVDAAGEEHDAELLDIGSEVAWSAADEMTLCHYDNAVGRRLCSSYRYLEGRMVAGTGR